MVELGIRQNAFNWEYILSVNIISYRLGTAELYSENVSYVLSICKA